MPQRGPETSTDEHGTPVVTVYPPAAAGGGTTQPADPADKE